MTGDRHIEDMSGTKNGANTTFNLSAVPNLQTLLVTHNTNTLYRHATIAGKPRFSISGSTVTLGFAPLSADDLWAFYEELSAGGGGGGFGGGGFGGGGFGP